MNFLSLFIKCFVVLCLGIFFVFLPTAKRGDDIVMVLIMAFMLGLLLALAVSLILFKWFELKERSRDSLGTSSSSPLQGSVEKTSLIQPEKTNSDKSYKDVLITVSTLVVVAGLINKLGPYPSSILLYWNIQYLASRLYRKFPSGSWFMKALLHGAILSFLFFSLQLLFSYVLYNVSYDFSRYPRAFLIFSAKFLPAILPVILYEWYQSAHQDSLHKNSFAIYFILIPALLGSIPLIIAYDDFAQVPVPYNLVLISYFLWAIVPPFLWMFWRDRSSLKQLFVKKV